MKRILVTQASGALGIGMARSLWAAPEPYHLIGVDSDPARLQRAQADERHLVPRATEDDYIDVLRGVVEKTGTDFVCPLLPVELVAVSAARDRVGARVFIPRHETLEVCEDKLASQQVWQRAGLPVPATMLIEDEADLRQAFQDFGPRLWLRAIRGAGGRDSLPVEDYETALAWMRLKDGWGTSTAAECLESSTITWQSIWKNGELVVAQARTRLYWEFTTVPLSGVTGVTGTGQTVSDPAADEIAMAAVKAVDPRPDGLFGVDLTYDRRGVPNLTEINCGRFFTTHHFFAAAGLNMAHIMIKAAFDEPIPELPRKINPLPPGLLWVRGMDRKPILSDWETVNRYEAELAARRQALSRTRAGR